MQAEGAAGSQRDAQTEETQPWRNVGLRATVTRLHYLETGVRFLQIVYWAVKTLAQYIIIIIITIIIWFSRTLAPFRGPVWRIRLFITYFVLKQLYLRHVTGLKTRYLPFTWALQYRTCRHTERGHSSMHRPKSELDISPHNLFGVAPHSSGVFYEPRALLGRCRVSADRTYNIRSTWRSW
jgi:hypothetical protein